MQEAVIFRVEVVATDVPDICALLAYLNNSEAVVLFHWNPYHIKLNTAAFIGLTERLALHECYNQIIQSVYMVTPQTVMVLI